MERGGVDETRGEVIGRRVRTVPPIVLGAILGTALLPVLIPLALIVDVVRFVTRRVPFMAIRMLLVIWVYLFGETIGILVFTLVWLFALARGGTSGCSRAPGTCSRPGPVRSSPRRACCSG